MKRRLMRTLSFILAISMIVISLDMPVLATGYDNYAEEAGDIIVSDEDEAIQPVTDDLSTDDEISAEAEETESADAESEETESESEDAEIIAEEIPLYEDAAIVDYDDVMEFEVVEIDLEDIEGEVIDADELLLEVEEAPIVYADSAADHDWDQYSNYYIYNRLSADEKKLWDALEVMCNSYLVQDKDLTVYVYETDTYYLTEYVKIKTTSITKERLSELVAMFIYSHPQYYYLRGGIFRSVSSTQISVSIMGYEKFVDGTERLEITNAINTLLEDWYKQIDACSTEEEKVKTIHDLICNKVNYNYDILEGDSAITNEEEAVAFTQTAYSVFCMDQTVCAGYAKAFGWVSNGAGIDAFGVTSDGHAWNKVRVNDSWYNIDCTWDGQNQATYYNYYLRNDDIFSGDSHIEEDKWLSYLPACTLDSGSSGSTARKLPEVSQQVSKPAINIIKNQDAYTITIVSTTPNAQIFYTLDGTEPTEADTRSYLYTGSFEVNGTYTIRAIAVCNEYLDSEIEAREISEIEYTVTTGTCGNNITWSLNSKGVLTLNGTGAMTSYDTAAEYPWYAYATSITEVVMSNGITNIGNYAFQGCTNLKQCTFPDSLTRIGEYAFEQTAIAEADIPAGVTAIGENAFSNCDDLTYVRINGNVEEFGYFVFLDCDALKTVELSDELETIGWSMFCNCNSLDNVNLPANLKVIADYAFWGCSGLEEIVIPQSVTSIGQQTFYCCYSLKSAEIHANVTTLPIGMFESCYELEQLTITSKITSIPEDFLWGCESMTGFVIPETVTSVDMYAFSGCTSLAQIYVPKTISKIGKYAFETTTTIMGYSGSAAETYAETYGNEFLDISEYGIKVEYVTNCDTKIAEQYYLEGSYVPEPGMIVKSGYTFGGWFTSASVQNETTRWDFANDVLTEDITLYAKWSANTYKVSFNANHSGAQAIDSKTVTFDAAYGELPAVSRTGYTFKGWYNHSSAGTLITADTIYKTTGDETLYARWTPNSYRIIFDANGGTVTTPELLATYDAVLGELPVPVKEGYTFKGWFTAEEDGTEFTSSTVVKITSQQTLYAHWDVNKYTVTLDAQGAELSETTRVVTYDASYGELPELEREGYTFMGWFSEDGKTVKASTVVKTAGNHTLYARWQAKTYLVILSAGDGSVTPKSTYVKFGSVYGELPVPELTGYTFSGWYTDKTGGELISADSVVTMARDHALNARYEANRYVISFDTDGGVLDADEFIAVYDSTYGPLPIPEKASCAFDGWYTAKEGGEEVTAETVVKILDNQTLYARWKYKYTVDAPVASISDGSEVKVGTKLHLTTETNGAKIYYTTDDAIGLNVSSDNGILYEDAIVIDTDITVYAIAVKEQSNSSDVISVTYTVKDESQNWGDITETDKAEYGFTDASQVPQELWVAGVTDACDYTGSAITFADLHVYHYKTLLQPKTDYAVKYSNNTKAGVATITITGKGNYAGTIFKTFTILPLDLSEATVLDVTLPYNEKVQKATATVTYLVDGKVVTLKKGTDYTYTYPGTDSKSDDYDSNAFKAPGTHTVIITGKGNYTGTTTFNQIITEKYVVGKMKLTAIKSQKYTGTAIEPEIKLMNGTVQLVEGTDYTVEYTNNTEVGKATVTITGLGEYTGTRTTTFNITGTALSKMKLNGFVSSLPWSEGAVEQDITFSYTTGSGANAEIHYLTEDVDYTVEYQNNTQAGTATVIFTGKGGYTGTVKKTYKITGLAISKAQVSGLDTTMVYDGRAMEQSEYDLTYTIGNDDAAQMVTLKEGRDYTVSYKSNDKVGTASIIFTGINGFTGTLKKTYKITAYDFNTVNGNIDVADIGVQSYVKGGSTPKPVVTYTNDLGSIVLTEGKDYTLKYSNHNAIADKTAEKAPTVTVTGKGNYKGSVSVKYTIAEGDISLVAMKAADVVYQNKAGICKPSIVLTDANGKKLAAGTDYDRSIAYTYAKDVAVIQMVNRKPIVVVRAEGEVVDKKDIIPVGAEITATVSGIKKYVGTQSVTFRYVAGSMAKASIKVNNQTYSGSPIEPGKDEIVVKIGKTVLEKTDYEIVSYSNNIKKGTAKITIRGVGNYGGEKTVTFKIVSKTMNYSITYDANAEDATGKMKVSSTAVGKVLTANAYKRAGYVFEGWNTEADGSGVSYVNKEKFSIKEGMTVYGTKITLYAQWSRLFDDEELSRIYSYDILEDEMFEDLEQTATAKDCYDYAIAYLENYDKEAVADFKYYVPNEPNEVEVETTDVLATVYLAAFVSDEAWVYSSDYDTILFDYSANQSFCYDAAHIGFDVWSGLYDDIYFKMDKTFVWNFGLESNGNYFALARRSPVSGKTVYEMDQNENLIESSCTREELVRMYGRLYEGNLWQDREATALDEQILADADSRRESILNSKTEVTYTGTAYYVSNEGNDENDGLTPETAWASLSKVSAAELQFGDAVFFERGDEFRGVLWAQEGVTYSAYGEGDKPILNTCPENLSGEEKWILYYEGEDGRKIWKYYDETEAYGSMIFNNGESYAKKRYLHYTADEIHLETDITVDFDVTVHLNNYEFMTTGDYDRDDSHTYKKTGELFVRLDEGNPGELYNSIECSTAEFNVEAVDNTTYDNLSLRYGQCAFIYGKENMTVQNCEVCFQGGYYFNPLWADESEAGTGAGDGITIGGWNNKAINNYVHHTYDDGITIEVPEGNKTHSNCIIEGNLIENCNGGILLVNWYDNPENGISMADITINDNYVLYSGDVWSHDVHYPGYFSSCSAFTNMGCYENGVQNITVTDNVFYLCRGTLVSFLVSDEQQDEVYYDGNTYVQYTNAYVGAQRSDEAGYTIMYGSQEKEEFINNIIKDLNGIY